MTLALRPPYDTVDFKALTSSDPYFKQIWRKTSGKLDFQDAETVKALSNAILQADFGLQLKVPDDRLCPPIPNRWNYVAWIQALIDSTSSDYSNKYDANRPVVGLDIGTGASAIYTMLSLKSRPNWAMCATDIDKKSFDSATRNLALNNLITRTRLLQTTELNALIPLAALAVDYLDFTICNPPFFNNASDMNASIKGEGKGLRPNAICTGAEVEMVWPGGDLGFVTTLVNESLVLREKVQWYSSMLGKLDSAKCIINLLKKHGITNWAVGVIDTGSSTKRWTVAWSFRDMRPRNSIARLTTIANDYLPFPTLYTIPFPATISSQNSAHLVKTRLSSLDVKWSWDDATSSGVGEASQNVWSRSYRREFERRQREGLIDLRTNASTGVALAFRIQVVDLSREVLVEWVRGSNRILWESFTGFVHRWIRDG